MQRSLVIAASLAAFAVPATADAAPGLVLDRPTAQPNERVTARATAASPRRSLRLYLLRADAAAVVRDRRDKRLALVGSLLPNRTGRGALTFSVPALDPGAYVLAVWCRSCAAKGEGSTFFVRRQARLTIEAAPSCPVTLPNGNRPPGQPRNVGWYGNGLLWAGLERDGTYTVPADRVAADGTIANKLLWVTTPPWEKPTISGERIDEAAAPLNVIGVNTGSFSGAANPSHMSPVGFPTAGCWRLKARLGDLSLVYVVQVLVAKA